MRLSATGLLFMLLGLLGSCQQNALLIHPPDSSPKTQENEIELVMIYANQTAQWESAYYEALFQLKKRHPEKDWTIRFVSFKDYERFIEKIKLQKTPALVILKNGKARIATAGKATTAKIYRQLQKAIP